MSDGGRTMTGGCQCGRIRYAARIDDDDAYLCHCRMCQRATGGVAIAFKSVARDGFRWEREPDWYASSPIARRPFRAACGTPLGFTYSGASTHLDVTVGSFDEPARFRPTHHFGTESLHEAWLDTHELPRMASADNDGNVRRWIDAVGHLPA